MPLESLPRYPSPAALAGPRTPANFVVRASRHEDAPPYVERAGHLRGEPQAPPSADHRVLQSLVLAPVGALCGATYGRAIASVGIDLGLYAWQGRVLDSFDVDDGELGIHSAPTCMLLYAAAGLVGAAVLPWLTAHGRTVALRAGYFAAQGPPMLGLCAAVGASLTTAAAVMAVDTPPRGLLQAASTAGAALGASGAAYVSRRFARGALTGSAYARPRPALPL